jgi:DNA helicase-2/ATP-dependent DNA helicase PcrA
MRRAPPTIEGQLIASSSDDSCDFSVGDRVRHQKFGGGTVREVDGNKLTIEFDTGDRKRVVASFLDRE